ncbi:UNVERIFIED_CONTAM: hypothetical protein RMT77_009683 [Armadillidium vulgare]
MNPKALAIFSLFLLTPSSSSGMDWEFYDEDRFGTFVFDDVAKGRIFGGGNFSDGQFVTFNQSLILFGGGVLLWGVAGAILLYYLLTVPAGASYDYEYSGGYGESEQGYSRSDKRCVANEK